MSVKIMFRTVCTKFVRDPSKPRLRRCADMQVYAVAIDSKTGKLLAKKRLTKATANKVADFT
jgi:hypothetical protein